MKAVQTKTALLIRKIKSTKSKFAITPFILRFFAKTAESTHADKTKVSELTKSEDFQSSMVARFNIMVKRIKIKTPIFIR